MKRLLVIFLTLAVLLIGLGACTSAGSHTGAPTKPPGPTPRPAVKATDDLSHLSVQMVYFNSFPKTFESVLIPTDLVAKLDAGTASVVALPKPDLRETLIKDIQASANTSKVDLANVNFTAVAFFPDRGYSAVPIMRLPEKFNFDEGVKVGLVNDPQGRFTKNPGVFTVMFYRDQATLLDGNGRKMDTFAGDHFKWINQEKPVEEPVAFFIKGSCWLCWSLDGRCGCLFCFD
jgi:hypothetical protein